jgi:hypothetical protein
MHSMICELCPAVLDDDTMESAGEFFVCPACAEKLRVADEAKPN